MLEYFQEKSVCSVSPDHSAAPFVIQGMLSKLMPLENYALPLICHWTFRE